MRYAIITCFFFCIGLTINAQNGSFHLGLGKYNYDSYDSYAVNFGIELKLNKIFSISLNGSLLDEAEEEFVVFSDLPPFTTTTLTRKFGGFTSTADLNLFLFGCANNKIQLHFHST